MTKQTNHQTPPRTVVRTPVGLFLCFFSRGICLALCFQSTVLSDSYRQTKHPFRAQGRKLLSPPCEPREKSKVCRSITQQSELPKATAPPSCSPQSLCSVKGSREREAESCEEGLRWLYLERELKKQTETNHLQKTNILLKNYKASSSIGALTVGNWSHG